MSTRCQIEFCSGDVRRTVYRHWDGYPSAVIPDLLAFLAWNGGCADTEYAAANFLYWSKRELGAQCCRLGFGICANDELHGDIEYYYVVAWEQHGGRITAHAIEHDAGAVHLGRVVGSAVYTPRGGRRLLPRPFSILLPSRERWMVCARCRWSSSTVPSTFVTTGCASFAAGQPARADQSTPHNRRAKLHGVLVIDRGWRAPPAVDY